MTELIFYESKSDLDWEQYKPFLKMISPERRARILRMPSAQTRELSLMAEVLLRQEAVRRLGVENTALTLAFSEQGKPFFKNYETFFFNWSHTRDALVIAVSDAVVGVDVERLPLRHDAQRLARRFFTAHEAAAVSAAQDPDARFAELWTRKEAYLKYTGTGLSVPLDSFDTLQPPASELLRTFTRDGWVISVCGTSPVACEFC